MSYGRAGLATGLSQAFASVGDVLAQAGINKERRDALAYEKNLHKKAEEIAQADRDLRLNQWHQERADRNRQRAQDMALMGIGVETVQAPTGALVDRPSMTLAATPAEVGKPVGASVTTGDVLAGDVASPGQFGLTYNPDNDIDVRRTRQLERDRMENQMELTRFYISHGLTPSGGNLNTGDGTGGAFAGRSISVADALDFLVENDKAMGVTRPIAEYMQTARWMAAGTPGSAPVMSSGTPRPKVTGNSVDEQILQLLGADEPTETRPGLRDRVAGWFGKGTAAAQDTIPTPGATTTGDLDPEAQSAIDRIEASGLSREEKDRRIAEVRRRATGGG